jgi:hypothetical protein
MSTISINLAEKRLLDHLRMGGDVFDAVGKALVVKFATTALKDELIIALATRYRISHQDICIIYAYMIRHLMPNPCVDASGLLLVPTLFFMESLRFEALASEICARTVDLSDEDRKEKMIELAANAGRLTLDSCIAARGEAKFEIQNLGGRKSAGCAVMILIGFSLASLSSYGIYKILA